MTNDATGAERRLAPRRRPDGSEPLAHARLRGGRNVAVADISRIGVLVEGAARLSPGTHVDLHVMVATGRELVRCRVVRAFVWRVSATDLVYRAGLAFERTVDVEVPGGAPAAQTTRQGPGGPGRGP